MASIAGINIGLRIRMAAVPSMKHPMNRRNRLITSRNTNLFGMLVSAMVSFCGICAMVRQYPKMLAVITIDKTTPVVSQVESITCGISFHLRSRYPKIPISRE